MAVIYGIAVAWVLTDNSTVWVGIARHGYQLQALIKHLVRPKMLNMLQTGMQKPDMGLRRNSILEMPDASS